MKSLSARNKYLAEVGTYVAKCNATLTSLVASFGWSADSLTRSAQLNADDAEESGVQADSTDELTGHNEESEDFEKLYNDLVAGLPSQWKKTPSGTEAKSLVDLLETERNMKRRRISYRNKVHTKNKSHTEVLRELVREQMDVLKVIAETTEAEETSGMTSKEDEPADGLIQLGYCRGHPYKIWQRIGRIVEQRERSELEPESGRRDRPDSSRRLTVEVEEKRKRDEDRPLVRSRDTQTRRRRKDQEEDAATTSHSRKLSHKRLRSTTPDRRNLDEPNSPPRRSSKKRKHKDKKSSRSHKHKKKRRSRSKS